MMKYLFILGRNIELSIEELKSFFEKEKINFHIISRVKNGLLVETEGNMPAGIIDKLGGTISIGEVLANGDFEEITKELDKIDLYSGESNKLNYVLLDFNGKSFSDILLYLKKRFREEGLKATEKKATGMIKLQGGRKVRKVSSSLINEQYFVLGNNFGKIIEISNYEEIEKRDMEKPVRRSELSISPRLAKILINLSQVEKGRTLLDPFCGIGVILQEALLQNIKVIGIDNDKKTIDGCKQNLKWFNFNPKNYKLIVGDSARINTGKIDGIATEPQLGELQKKTPSFEMAKEIIQEFEKLIILVLRNLGKNINGRIVFTAPLIRVGKQRISCNFAKISSETGLKIIMKPIDEFREDSIVGRSIVVMGK